MRFSRKAQAALLASIELFNKPDFRYREEAFTILALNAWELLLKAKLLAENNNRLQCLTFYQTRLTKSGRQSKRKYVKTNRAGNAQTIGLGQVIGDLEAKGTRLPAAVRHNLDGLMEIRDNAIHFINADPRLAKQVLELGTAAVKNFIELAKQWFRLDLSAYNLYLMPIGFVAAPGVGIGLHAGDDEGRLIRYIAALVRDAPKDDGTDFHVSLEVNLSFKRSAADAAAVVAVTNDPDAAKVALSEEDVRKIYPWDYAELTRRMKARYIDFSANTKYHEIRKTLAQNPQFVKTRLLDPSKPSGLRKDFFNPNVVAEFDKFYTRRASA